jgi:hypothetical protein
MILEVLTKPISLLSSVFREFLALTGAAREQFAVQRVEEPALRSARVTALPWPNQSLRNPFCSMGGAVHKLRAITMAISPRLVEELQRHAFLAH